MSYTEDIQNRIDHYLMKTDSPEERKQFREEMEANPELKQEVELQWKMFQGIILTGMESLKADLKVIHQQEIGEAATAKVRAMRRWYPIGAMAVAAAVLILWVIFRLTPATTQELYASFGDKFPDIGLARTLGIQKGDSLTQDTLALVKAYLESDYQKAKSLMEAYAQSNSETLETNLNLGIVYHKGGEEVIDKALLAFSAARQEAKERGIHNSYKKASWGMILTYLKRGTSQDIAKCIEVAEELALDLEKIGTKEEKKRVTNLLESLAQIQDV